MVTESIERLAGAVLDLVYPPRCALCERHGEWLCDRCLAGLPRADGRRCRGCWLPLPGPSCRACEERPPAFSTLRSVFRYEGEVRRLVHAFKFGGQSVLGRPLAALLVDAWRGWGMDADVAVPVPLTAARARLRGYNQALLLAREVARGIGVRPAEALRRTGRAAPQATSAGAEERRRNVAGAFAVRDGAAVAGRKVLLVDDVATTGATLNACAEALLAAGAARVLALTLARED